MVMRLSEDGTLAAFFDLAKETLNSACYRTLKGLR